MRQNYEDQITKIDTFMQSVENLEKIVFSGWMKLREKVKGKL